MKTRKDSETIALEALAFIATNDEELGRFLGNSGLDEQTLRRRAGTREVLGAALGHVLGYEPIAKAFADAHGYTPETLMRAGHELGVIA